ncbi:MAG: SAM-dependent methyltransferase, partial [Stackebrandtia sp.]
VHDTARRVKDDVRVVYVDHDPVVVTHNRALRATGPGLAIIHDSFMNLDGVFSHEDFQSNIDTSRPVAVLMLSVLQNNTDEQILRMMADLRSRLAPGSYLALSHVSSRTSKVFLDAVAIEIEAGRYPPTDFRSDERIAEFFTGYELVEPGIVDYRDWHPTVELEDQRPELNLQFTCGVGRLS